jgi:hypothetical protein
MMMMMMMMMMVVVMVVMVMVMCQFFVANVLFSSGRVPRMPHEKDHRFIGRYRIYLAGYLTPSHPTLKKSVYF